MVVGEAERYRLHRRLDEVLGPEHAEVLMAHLPPSGWADLATKRDVEAARADVTGSLHRLRAEVQGGLNELRAELDGGLNELRAELKGEMNELRAELKGEMSELGAELKGEMSELGAELKGEMSELRAELKGEMNELRAQVDGKVELVVHEVAGVKEELAAKASALEMRQQFTEVRQCMERELRLMTWRLVTLVVAMAGVVIAAVRL